MQLRRQFAGQTTEHQRYLNSQLRRSLLKIRGGTEFRGTPLIRHLQTVAGEFDGKSVLCIGCRTDAELNSFRRLGASPVTGIDLFAQFPGVLVMDMHALQFPDGTFDMIFASHSLEHALDPDLVAREVLRTIRPGGHIAIEVPVNFRQTDVDLQDYGSAAGVVQLFRDRVESVVWQEELASASVDNQHGTDIVRVIFQVNSAKEQR
jgi:SAM-dependent methyltransferase